MTPLSSAESLPSPSARLEGDLSSTGPLPRSERRGPLTTFLHRVAICYLVLYTLNWYLVPLGLDLASVNGLWKPIVTKTALHLYSTPVSYSWTGSGDSTYRYFEVVTLLMLSLPIGAVWFALARGKPVHARTREMFANYIRYGLALTMFLYGWAKAIPVQFPFPGPDRLISTFGDASPMGLLWAFMGASPAYEIISGVAELTGGLLLFFRRTALLGALISAGVLTNVVALNFCYDVPVKLFSSHLLLICTLLILPHFARLKALFLFNPPPLPTPTQGIIKRSWKQNVLLLGKVAFFLLIAVRPAYQNFERVKTEKPLKTWEGIYRVQSFARESSGASVGRKEARWLRVGINAMGSATIQYADGTTQRYRIEVDPKETTFKLNKRGDPATIVLKYSMPDPDTLEVRGDLEERTTTVRLVRNRDYLPLLTTRGFHWVNEVPFNR